jgi:hypothetical protein
VGMMSTEFLRGESCLTAEASTSPPKDFMYLALKPSVQFRSEQRTHHQVLSSDMAGIDSPQAAPRRTKAP